MWVMNMIIIISLLYDHNSQLCDNGDVNHK